ncbi:MAG: FdtA/QdtA family cupin domain-containing protein [Syntrophomonas sp.]
MNITTYNFQIRGDDRGSLVAIEESLDIPFALRRVYYIFNTGSGVRRGRHAHYTLRQVLVCVHGSCKILLDDGRETAEVLLDRTQKGLLVDRMIWHEMYEFSPDCVLLALASDLYDEGDYIRNYDEFRALVRD